MIFENYIPQSEILQEYIECFFYFKGYTTEHDVERIVPDGSMNLIFEFDGFIRHVFDNETLEPIRDYTKAWLSGMHKSYISISVKQNSEMFVIRFKPGGSFPFLHLPVHELTDTVIDIPEVMNDEVMLLRKAMKDANTPNSKFDLAEKWLLKRMDEEKLPTLDIKKAISNILTDPTFVKTNLNELIEKSSFSQKHFIHLFKKYTGLTPKYFQRIVRFNEILMKVRNEQKIEWAQISYECGFFDQAHFIKEFKQFSGFNPKEFLDIPMPDDRPNFFPIDKK